jgi:hypothetical protein
MTSVTSDALRKRILVGGAATHVSHTGDRPIAITWKLASPMPPDLYSETALAIG